MFNVRLARRSFVSVTQPFNTTSRGSLTLNVLLSFAQFERDVTARHREDCGVQRKGMLMGGFGRLATCPRTFVAVDAQKNRGQRVQRFHCTWSWGVCVAQTSLTPGAGSHPIDSQASWGRSASP